MKKIFHTFTLFSSAQWFFFLFANTVVVPISIGAAFQLPLETISMTMRVSLIFTGIACIIQGKFGHRYPLMEGHSGLLWGVMLNLSLAASSMGLSYTEIGGGIASGVLLAGITMILIAALNLVPYVQKIFSPMVISVYLFLLTFQLGFVFFKGMLKITDEGTLHLPITLLSVIIVIFTALLKVKGNKAVSNFFILIGIVVGWILYAIFFSEDLQKIGMGDVSFSFFPLGTPNLQLGIILVAYIAGLINMVNTFSSIQAAADLFHEKPSDKQYRRSFLWTGIFSCLSTCFGLVPYTPFTSTIGFLLSTRIYNRKPFFIGGVCMTVIGIIEPFCAFLATMPITIGNAVLFVAYLQLFGTALNSIKGITFTSSSILRIAFPVLLGVSLMNTPQGTFSNLPSFLQPLISNGFVMGVVLSIIIEQVWVRQKKTVL